MANNDDVLIVGSLKDEELRKSIDNLVDYVGDKTNEMAKNFNEGLDKMKLAMKDFAVTQKVSVDLMKQAWREMSTSFDAMVAAQSGATGGGSGSGKPAYAPNTVGALEQEIKLREQNIKLEVLDTDQLKQANRELEKRKELLAREKGLNTMAEQARQARKELQAALTTPSNTLEQAEKKLKNLKDVASKFPKASGALDAAQWNRLQNAIDKTREKIEKLNMTTPTLKTIKGMDEKSVDDIAKKLRALRNVQVDPKNTAQVKKLGDEYQRLTRLQNELLGKGIQLTKSNNYLAQSFGYIRNRIVYALTLGAATSFVKQVYEIRAQYELLERSLGVLLGSFERGSQIFQELNTMALKSPFTLMELGTAAKQLTAYNFQANEVVNTTRRLADLSAALGVPMERLTYNLGQIRAQTVLTARDARDFANAGLPIVKSLADHFSQLEGRVVTTGDVFDRMSKKAVSYNDVMTVLNQMTDEGGKFFDFQAKQAETLRVQLANLTLAWNNMLNEVGEANQGLLTAPIVALKSLFQNWGEISHVITEVVVGLGVYKGTQLVVNRLMGESAMVMKKSILVSKEKAAADLEREATTRKLLVSEQKQIANKGKIVAADYQAILSTRELTKTQALLLAAFNKQDKELMKALVKMKLLKKAEIENITVGKALGIVFKQMGVTLVSLGRTIAMFSKQMLAMAAIGAVVEALYTWSEISDKIKDINKSIVDSAKESADSIAKFLNDYRDTYRKAFEYSSKVAKNGAPTIMADGAPKYKNLNDEEAQKAWQAIKEQIELSSAASSTFISRLMAINDVNDRVRAGFDYLEKIHDVNGALETLDEKAIDIAGDWSKWWNLWTLPDGLIDNLKDYQNQLDKVAEKWGSLANARAASEQKIEGADGDLHDVVEQYDRFVSDLQKTTASMYNSFTSVGINTAEGMREAFEKSNQKILADGNLSSKEQLQYNMEAEQQFIDYRKSLFEEEYAFEKERGNTERANRIKEEEEAWVKAFGSGRAVSDAFFNWLKNQHASEITKMFGNMSKKELEQLDWSEEKWQKWARDNAESFSKQYGISFDKLKGLVNEANTWKIFLKLFITTDEKGVYETLKDADAAANTAWSKIQRLKQRQAELNKIPASKLTDEQQDEAKNLLTELTQAQNDYNDALAKGGHASKQTKAATKAQKTAEQEVADALRQELAVIRDIQSNYDKLRKSGVDNMDAINIATQGYADTLYRVNSILQKYGVNKFNAKEFAGKDVHKLLETLQKQRDDLVASGKIKPGSLKDLDVEIQKLKVDAKTYDMKKVTDGLNNELAKVKEEYELAVELDANPELGNMFADMFGIDTSTLPKTFGDALDRAQIIINRKLAEMDITTPFDLMAGNIDSFAKSTGLDKDSAVIKELVSAQNAYRDMFKKNITETEKILDDYIKKYGDYSDKIAEIEADRLEKLKKLNEAYYTEEMRKRPEYIAKLNAIEQGASKEKQQVDFDDFKNSRYYTMMFENLDYISTKTIRDMRDRVRELMDTMNDLTPEQLKTLISQYEKLEQKLVKRSPFKTLTKDLKEYFATSKERNAANQEFKNAQKEYDAQKKNVAALKEKYEQAKANSNTSKSYLDFLQIEINGENEILQILKEQLEAAQKKADKYNLIKKLALEEASQVAQVVSSNLQSLGELRDFLQQDLGVELSDELNGLVDGLSKVGQGINKITSSATSGDIVGVITGVGQTIYGLYDGFASIFGGGSAADKKITRQIEDSERAVKRLENAYKELEYAAGNAFGAATSGAQEAIKANKELQLVELKRQLALEQSRDSKRRDEDRIIEIRGQIIDLEHEIKDFTKNAVNDLLGISSHGDFFESMISEMIEAFKNGEDAMEVFEEKWSDMIDNMIMKAIVSQVLSQWVKSLEHGANEILEKYTEESSKKIADIANEMANLRTMDAGDVSEWIYDNDRETFNKILESLGVEKAGDMIGVNRLAWFNEAWGSGLAKKIMDAYLAMLDNNMAGLQDELDKQSLDATGELIDYYGEAGKEFKENYLGQILDKIQENWNFGQDSEKQLSNLQQGIQGITEDTAGSLEAYMNGVSQQVYLHSDLLTQIRDAVVGFNLDVQVATIGEMLYQMQQSYQVQQAIQARLDGWSNANGMAVRVEMV